MTIDINDWAMAEMNDPCFGVTPVFQKVAQEFSNELVFDGEEIILDIAGKPGVIDGHRAHSMFPIRKP